MEKNKARKAWERYKAMDCGAEIIGVDLAKKGGDMARVAMPYEEYERYRKMLEEPSDKVIEKVAKVLHHERGYEFWPEPSCTQCEDAAKAVIKAFQETMRGKTNDA